MEVLGANRDAIAAEGMHGAVKSACGQSLSLSVSLFGDLSASVTLGPHEEQSSLFVEAQGL